jgi:cation/acetate symporter
LRNHLTDEQRQSRASLDGRVAFAAAAVALGAGLIVLLDRVGVPEGVAIVLGFVLATLTLCFVGLPLRSVRISTFYAGGREIPASYAGLAGAACFAALVLIFLPPLPSGLSLAAIGWGVGGGITGLMLLSAPVLRKTGSFSVADLLAARFLGLAFRLPVVAVVAVVCGLTALAGFEQAIRVIETVAGGTRLPAALLTGAILIVVTVPGGLAGSIWTGAAAAGLAIAGMALPLLVLAGRGADLPTPFVGNAEIWSHASERVSDWTQLAANDLGALWLAAPLALGLAGFAPLLSIAIGCRSRTGAQHAQLAMTAWLLLILGGLAITFAATALGLDLALAGQRPDRLADIFYQASADGWLKICGQFVDGPAPARAACAALPDFAAVLRPSDYAIEPRFLTFELSKVRGLGGSYSGLAGAGWFAVCVALAAAGLQGVSTTLGNDLIYRVADSGAITSRRLAIARLLFVVSVIGMVTWSVAHSFEPRALVGLALVLSAATITPLVLLSLWPRAGGLEATLALLAGLGAAGAVLFMTTTSDIAVHLGMAASAGAAVALATGLLVSLRPRAGLAPGAQFLDTLMHGASEALNPDKGA